MRRKHNNEVIVEPETPTTLDDIMARLPEPVTLTGDLARFYEEFRLSAADLEGKFKAHQDAEQRYRKALAVFSKLACGQKLEGPV